MKNHIDMLIFQSQFESQATSNSLIASPNLRFGSRVGSQKLATWRNSVKKLWDFCWGMYKKYEEGINYLIFGFLAFVLNYILYIIFSRLLDLYGIESTVPATALSWLLTVFFAYWTNRTFVFKSKNKDKKAIWQELSTFIGARVVTGVLEVVMMFLAVDCAGWNEYICKLVCQTLVIVANYFLSKLWIFKEKK